MKIKYKIIDNFLSKEEFKIFSETIMGLNFPWYYTPEINYNHTMEDKTCYFSHLVYHNHLPNSSYYETFKPILNKLDLISLLRIKVNFDIRTEKIEIHKKHVDYNFKHKGLLFSINDCNGGTVLKDGTKINSKKNRALFFDSSILHSSTSCTDAKGRFNANINYL